MQHEHWTLNEDLLAAYVLGRLSEADRETCARHLDTCAECKKRVDDEQVLAAGVQRAGREDLKARLRERLGEQHKRAAASAAEADEATATSFGRAVLGKAAAPQHAPAPPPKRGRGWIYAAATAACVVIVTGVGILNRWWSPDTIQTVSVEEERAAATTPAAKTDKSPREQYAARAEESGGDARKAASPPPAAQRPSPSTETSLSRVQTEQKEAQRRDVEAAADKDRIADGTRRKEAERLRAADHYAETAQVSETDHDARTEKREEAPAPGISAGIGTTDEGTWIEGETAYIRMGKGANIATNEADNARRAVTGGKGSGQTPARLNATVRQRPLTDAPVLQQQQRRAQSQRVLANMQQTDSMLRLTLYPEPQLSERDLRQAEVYRTAPDTIVVVLPGQVIRYRVESQAAMPVK